MSSEQQYRPLKAGEILSNGDQYLDVCGNWIGYPAHRFGQPISKLATGRRPVVGETETETETETVVQSEQPSDESLPATAESLRASLIDTLRCNAELHKQIGEVTKERDDAITLHAVAESNCRELLAKYDAARKEMAEITKRRDELQEAYDRCLTESNLIVQDGQKAKAELEASQRAYMAAMAALEREVVQHRETNSRLDEVCGERDALQEQLNERSGEPSKSEILDFLGVQIAVIPYLQAAVGKDAQRELTIAGRTLQMVHAAIESDRIGRPGEGKEANDGKE